MVDERALIERLQRGDPSAFRETFDQHKDRLYRLALNLLHDPDEAEDAVQEAFISLTRGIADFEGRSQLGTWLYRVTYNAALQRLRRAQRPQRSVSDDSAAAERLEDPSAGPEERLDAAELRRRLDAAMATLPDSLRMAFFLRDVEGLSTLEAADTLGVTESALKVRLHRARLALREQITDGPLPGTTTAAGMSCEMAVSHVSDYLDGALADDIRTRVEAHVEGCDHCRITLDSTRHTVALAGERRAILLPAPRSVRLFTRLQAILAARAPEA